MQAKSDNTTHRWSCRKLINVFADTVVQTLLKAKIVTVYLSVGETELQYRYPPFVVIFWYIEALETYFYRFLYQYHIAFSLTPGQINKQVSCLQECS